MSTNKVDEELEKILIKLRTKKNVEDFDNTEKEKIIEVVSNNDVNNLDVIDKQIITNAFNKLSTSDPTFKEKLEYVTDKTYKKMKFIKKIIIIIITAIIIYLIWKIVNKLFNRKQTVVIFSDMTPTMSSPLSSNSFYIPNYDMF